MRFRRARRRKNTVSAGEPAQIYLREAGRRRRPWRLLALLAVLGIIGGAALYALAVGAI